MKPHSVFETIGLNESPNLSMEEITKSLFNNEFLSDIQFKFETEVIFAHTWELKKRSIVFQNEFGKHTAGDMVIEMYDTQYATFYEFIRFIYTDECDINEYNRVGLLKLAMKYKVVRLETILINGLSDCFDVFEFCVLEKYDLIYYMMREWVENELHTFESIVKVQQLHPDVLEEILKLDYLQKFDELKVFNLLLRWINCKSEQDNVPLAEQHTRFERLIQLVRFPSMTIEQFTDCVNHSIDLFTKQDIVQVFRQISMGAQCPDHIWNSKPRLSNKDPYRVISVANHWETKLTVLSNVILRGIRFGYCHFRSNIHITVTGKDVKSNVTETLIFNFDKTICNDSEMVINLGETIELKPNYEYTVEIDTEGGLKVPIIRDDHRPKIQDVALNLAQPKAVRKLKESHNLLEIIYIDQGEKQSNNKFVK